MRSITKHILIAIAMILCSVPFNSGIAQQVDVELLKGMEPRNVGPAGMSGRITAIDVVQSNTNMIYVGAASGGVWKSDNGGITWESIFDSKGPMAIGALDIYQKNPSIIWMGTGEGNPRNSQSSGAGIYKSIDGGKTWELMGLEETRNIHRVIIDPDNPDVVYVGAQGSAWGDSEHRGVYKTTDGGQTWEKILYNNDRTGVGEMVMDPQNPNKLFVNMWEFRRWPWFFESGGEGSGLYMTLDGGDTWKELTSEDGLPEGELGRMGIAIAPSEPDIVYALIESSENAIYRSTDGGYNWELREKVKNDGAIGNRPFYYHEIYVDPENENRIYSLYSMLSKSEDGGKSFESMYPYYNWVHPDHHAFWINPDNPKHLIDGNDGGLNFSFDGGKTWRFAENIPVGQFYHVNVDMETPYNIYGGMQDNGTWQGPAYVWRSGGIRNSYWEELFFGDGFDVAIDHATSGKYVYAMSQRGNVGRVDTETGSSRFVQPTHPEGEELRFNWNAGINVDPFDEETIYFGSQYVHRSTDRGETWEIISPDITTNDTTKQKQHMSGGLTIDATGAENYTTVTVIEPSPLEDDVIWAGTDDGNIQISQDDGETWTNVSGNLRGVPEGSWIVQIKASHHNEGEAFAVVNDYRRDNWTPYLMHTTNYGKRWTNLVDENDVEGYTLSFVQDPVEGNLMFLGTEFGLYVSVDGGDNWNRWSDNYPTVSTYDMVIHPREHDLVIGTFGRSFWVIDDIRPLREVAAEGVDELTKPIKAFPSPDAYLAEWRQARGIRFAADAMFSGDNRSSGAMLSYSVNMDALENEEKEENKKEEEVTIEIYDASGEKIRTLTRTPQHNGINRTTWGLERAGVERPSRSIRNRNNYEPGGRDVLPGTYKVKFTYGEHSDSTNVTVHTDPRIEMPLNALRATYELEGEVEELSQYLANATKNLARAQEILEINSELISSDERSKEDLQELHDAHEQTQEKLEELFTMIFGEQTSGQGIVRSPDPTVLTHLYAVNRYLGGDYDGPGARERNLLRLAEEAVNEAVSKINTFVTEDWAEYQNVVEDADLSPFKDLEPVTKE